MLALAAGIVYVGAGGVTAVAGMVGSAVAGFVEDVMATPTPAPTPVTVSSAPTIATPAEPYTNQDTIDLIVTVSKEAAGDEDQRLRVYLALKDQAPAAIQETPLAAGRQTIVPVTLTEGVNDFTVTLVGPAGESDPSPVVRYILDIKKPAIKLTAPRDGATVNRKAVDLEGRTQGRSTLIARNRTTGRSIGGTADGDGRFTLRLPLTMGRNHLVISATDPAGNVNEIELTVARGSGELRAALSASVYTVKIGALPEEITLTVTVDDPDGKPLEGAEVTFTLSIPGVKTVTGDATTDANGRAVFTTTIPKGAKPGGGSATVWVRTSEFGSTTAPIPITIKK